MEKFTILDMLEGFPVRGVSIGQMRASQEVGPTQVAYGRDQGGMPRREVASADPRPPLAHLR